MAQRAPLWFHYLLLALVIAAGLSACREENAASTGKPGFIQVRPESIYLGSVEKGRTLPFEVALKNGGPKPITITDLVPTCGCTQVKLQEDHLLPGATTKLAGTLSSAGRIGEFGSKVLIEGIDSGGTPLLAEVFVGARSVVPVEAWPMDIRFPQLFLGDGPAIGVLKLKRGEADIDWDDLSITSDHLLISKERLSRTSFRAKITVDLRSPSVGSFGDSIRIGLLKGGKNIENQTLNIPVRWRIDSRDLTVTPRNIYYGVLQPGETQVRRIQISAPKGIVLAPDSIQTEKTSGCHASFVRGSRPEVLWVDCTLHNPGMKQVLTSYFDAHIRCNGKKLTVREDVMALLND